MTSGRRRAICALDTVNGWVKVLATRPSTQFVSGICFTSVHFNAIEFQHRNILLLPSCSVHERAAVIFREFIATFKIIEQFPEPFGSITLREVGADNGAAVLEAKHFDFGLNQSNFIMVFDKFLFDFNISHFNVFVFSMPKHKNYSEFVRKPPEPNTHGPSDVTSDHERCSINRALSLHRNGVECLVRGEVESISAVEIIKCHLRREPRTEHCWIHKKYQVQLHETQKKNVLRPEAPGETQQSMNLSNPTYSLADD